MEFSLEENFIYLKKRHLHIFSSLSLGVLSLSMLITFGCEGLSCMLQDIYQHPDPIPQMSVQLLPSLLPLQPCDNEKISPDIAKYSQGGGSTPVEAH